MRLGGLYPIFEPDVALRRAPDYAPVTPPNLLFVRPGSVDDFDDITPQLDRYGLSAIGAPWALWNRSLDECAAFGERARKLGIMVGEASFNDNLMVADQALVNQRINDIRRGLRNADAMQCRTLHILPGTKDPAGGMLTPHPVMFTDAYKAELREVVLRIMDGLDLQHTRFLIEPFNHSFFYQPEDIREFFDAVDHPRVGFQMDVVNMIAMDTYFDTTSLIHRTFDLLGDFVYSSHVKDMQWDHGHLTLKWDEVLIGQGTLDLATYLQRLDELDPETPCYCEHLPDEASYAHNFAKVHEVAEQVGVVVKHRQGG